MPRAIVEEPVRLGQQGTEPHVGAALDERIEDVQDHVVGRLIAEDVGIERGGLRRHGHHHPPLRRRLGAGGEHQDDETEQRWEHAAQQDVAAHA